MKQHPLEITLLYYSNEGREVSFTDLANDRDRMDASHYEPSAFWNISGGFEVTLNGHATIFHSCNFYCLVKATSFLIHSLYWIKGKTSDWFDVDDDFPNDVLIHPTPGTLLRLKKANTTDLSFSYLPTDKTYEPKRGDRYFSDINFNSAAWFEQTNLALSEYFNILKLVLAERNKSDRLVETMTAYLKVWQNISNMPINN